MKKVMVFIFILITILSCQSMSQSTGSESGEFSAEALEQIGNAYKFFIVLEETKKAPLRYMYADVGQHVHVYKIHNGRSVLEWESTNLGSPIASLLATDLNKDGNKTIMIATRGGRILGFDANSYEKVFENFLEIFESIACLITENIDEDPQDEIIMIAEGFLHIYDSSTAALQWKSVDSYLATEMIMANVDDDDQLEIILNTGHIVDSKFLTLESAHVGSGAFGLKMRLLDVNGDGYPEIIGETSSFALKIYDIYAQREIW